MKKVLFLFPLLALLFLFAGCEKGEFKTNMTKAVAVGGTLYDTTYDVVGELNQKGLIPEEYKPQIIQGFKVWQASGYTASDALAEWLQYEKEVGAESVPDSVTQKLVFSAKALSRNAETVIDLVNSIAGTKISMPDSLSWVLDLAT